MNLKDLVSKVRLLDNYPYTLPNTNITLKSPYSAEINSFTVGDGVIRAEVAVGDKFLSLLSNRDIAFSNYETSCNKLISFNSGDNFFVIELYGKYKCFLTKDFLHILSEGIGKEQCNLWLIRRDTLNVEFTMMVDFNKIPKFSLSSIGYPIVTGYLPFKEIGFDEFKEYSC